jgi:hypothetical protein
VGKLNKANSKTKPMSKFQKNKGKEAGHQYVHSQKQKEAFWRPCYLNSLPKV